MAVALAKPLPRKWRKSLGLAGRRVPEFYDNADKAAGAPYASAIRTALSRIGLSCVYCVQGFPTVGIVVMDQYDRDDVHRIRAELWNQGHMCLLLVIAEDTVRAFTLSMRPLAEPTESYENRCLLGTLNLTADALRIREWIDGAETGRLWNERRESFPATDRVDKVLLDNLTASHELMQKSGLAADAAQALLIQTIFIAYLEDREIATKSYFKSLSGERVESFSELLDTGDAKLFEALFHKLRRDFNGDLFIAPCSFEKQARSPRLTKEHLSILAQFRAGKMDMKSGQTLFWGYDFSYIPIELVSAVYDRFLGERVEERRSQGAYYTPMFLADLIVLQLWEALPDRIKRFGRFLDPACGSGIFLVRAFQRACENWRRENHARSIPWETLRELLGRMHGWDKDGNAVRIAVFSLYVALLEEVSSPDILKLIKSGKILPEIWSKTLVCQDFFTTTTLENEFDVIIGNPPWVTRGGSERSSVRWANDNGYPMPYHEDAWAFTWKATRHLSDDGAIGFLLPAMGFLHNYSSGAVQAREALFKKCRVSKIINFSDLRFQLFDSAIRPATLIIFGRNEGDESPCRFDYWSPKAGPSLISKRVITMSSEDKLSLSDMAVFENPYVFKEQMRMREADAKLFAYMERLPKLGDLAGNNGDRSGAHDGISKNWSIGHGYAPSKRGDVSEAKADNASNQRNPSISDFVGKLPDLPIEGFNLFVQRSCGLRPAQSNLVYRRGVERGFEGIRILVPRGIKRRDNRIRAAYCEESLTFKTIIMAISVPEENAWHAKLLTAILNSRITIWHAFHAATYIGTERPAITHNDILRFPFPLPSHFKHEAEARSDAHKLVGIIDDEIERSNNSNGAASDQADILRRIDQLSFSYFGLSEDEVAMIDDTVDFLIPGAQPSNNMIPELWRHPDRRERASFAAALSGRLNGWLRSTTSIGTRMVARNQDFGILRISLDDESGYDEDAAGDLTAALDRLTPQMTRSQNDYLETAMALRIFSGGFLYIVKPMQLRYWLRSAAFSDADDIALEMQDLPGHGQLRRAV